MPTLTSKGSGDAELHFCSKKSSLTEPTQDRCAVGSITGPKHIHILISETCKSYLRGKGTLQRLFSILRGGRLFSCA